MEEDLIINLIKLSTKIALEGSCPCRFPWRNLFLIDHVKDEIAKDPGLAKISYLGSTSFVLSCNPTPGPILVSALILALVRTLIPTPALTLSSFDKLLKQFMKADLKSNQEPSQHSTKRK